MSICKQLKNVSKASKDLYEARLAYENSCHKITKDVSIIEWSETITKEVAFLQNLLELYDNGNEQKIEQYLIYAGNYCKAPSCFYKYFGLSVEEIPNKCMNILFNNKKACYDCSLLQDRKNFEVCKAKLELAVKKKSQANIELIDAIKNIFTLRR